VGSPDETPSFRPARLDRKDLEVPVKPGLLHFPPEERERLHAKEVAWHRQFDLLAPPSKRKMAVRGAMAAVGAVLLAILFEVTLRSGPGLAGWWALIPLGGAWGAWFARTQPAPVVAGIAFAGVYYAACLVTGTSLSVVGGMMVPWCWLLCGAVAGVSEQSRRWEGQR
jgi:hypothetical protein